MTIIHNSSIVLHHFIHHFILSSCYPAGMQLHLSFKIRVFEGDSCLTFTSCKKNITEIEQLTSAFTHMGAFSKMGYNLL